MQKNKVVLAFSGGLDTSYCGVFLSRVMQMEVHAVLINTGGFSIDEISDIERRAMQLGITSFKCIDAQKQYYESCLKYMIFGNVLKNGTYPLSVSSERVVQAIAIANYANELHINCVAHGSTGAGNDQVRFDMVFQNLIPNANIITPIRDQKISREDEILFLKSNGIEFNFEKAAYSINKGLWGTSVGGKETTTSHLNLPESAWPNTLTASESLDIVLHFNKGELIGINETEYENSESAIVALQSIAQPFAIGRDIHVGDTIIGIKGRVGFEAAAAMIVIKAHHLLEKHVLTKWQLYWKDQLALWYGNWLHEGQMLDPVMRDIESFFSNSQNNVSGKVFASLMPYRLVLNGIESIHDLMSNQFGTYGEMNNSWSGEDVKGFTKIFGNQMSIYNRINQSVKHA